MSILCSMVGASFTVAAAAEIIRYKKGIVANGNAQIDTAQSKFGGSSALFDGTGDYLLVENIAGDITGDFTFECFVRFSAFPSSGSFHMLATGDSNRYFALKNDGGTQKWESSLMTGANQYVARYTPTISTGVWYHIALIKSGGTLTLYQDGVALTATTVAGSMTSSSTLFVSGTNILGAYTSANYSLNGWLDEIRISNSARYTTGFTPSTTAFVNDSNTLLLLHMDGTDATTYFEDDNGVRASKGIVASGNAQLDTAQYKFGGSSALFDGTDDYLRIFDLEAIGTGDFTVEFWFRPNYSSSPNMLLWDNRGTTSTSTGAQLINFIGASPVINYWVAGSYRITGTTVLSSGTWYHIAVSRSGTSTKLFVNGTQDGSTYTDSNNYVSNPGQYIASAYDGGADTNGHIDEFRVSNTARYTTAFTAPTQPFVNDSNTVLLLHMDGTDGSTVFRDDNGYSARAAKHISYYGNAQLDTAQSKFGGTSALFDGTGDYLIVAGNPIPTSGSFTVEFFIRFSSLGTLRPIWSNRDTGGTNRGVLYINASGGLTWWNASDNLNFGSNLSANTWYHIACVKDGSTRRLFVDGAGMVTDSGSYTAGDVFQIGRADYTSSAFAAEIAGHIDEFRVSNTARYTANFTAPTAAFTNDANTVLLLHFNGADAATVFEDDNGGRASRGVVVSGNAQISTAQSKFGGSSALFDGTGDYLTAYYNTNFEGDFTVECWARWNSLSNDDTVWMFGNTDIDAIQVYLYTAAGADQNKLRLDIYNRVGAFTNITVTTGVWYHLATVRSGSTVTLYVDGTSRATVTRSGTIGNNGNFRIGGGSFDMNGYVDEFRVSNTARYTSNFTAPTAPFSNDANTLLLLHMDGTDGSTVFVDDNGQVPQTP